MLTNAQKKALKAKAHHLKPVVMVGAKGLSDNLFKEIEIALAHHELIKVKISNNDNNEREAALQEICLNTECFLIQSIGKIGILYKENPNKS